MPKLRPNSVYEWSQPAWDRIAVSDMILDPLLAEAERGRVWAESESPVDTGRFASSFTVEATTVLFKDYGLRAAAELQNETPYAATVEFGSDPWTSPSTGKSGPGNQPQRVLRRTAEYLGL